MPTARIALNTRQAGFDPRQLPNLECWYDGRWINGFNTPPPAEFAPIGQWNDLSGNNRHALQTIAVRQPHYRSRNWNMCTAKETTALAISPTAGLDLGITYNAIISNPSIVTPDVPYLGLQAVQGTLNATGNALFSTSSFHPAVAGQTYTGMAASRAPTTSRAMLRLYWYDAGNALLSAAVGTNVYHVGDITGGAWTLLAGTFVAPANTASVRVMVQYDTTTNPVGTTWQATGFALCNGTVPVPTAPQFWTAPGNVPGVFYDGSTSLNSMATAPFILNGGAALPGWTWYVSMFNGEAALSGSSQRCVYCLQGNTAVQAIYTPTGSYTAGPTGTGAAEARASQTLTQLPDRYNYTKHSNHIFDACFGDAPVVPGLSADGQVQKLGTDTTVLVSCDSGVAFGGASQPLNAVHYIVVGYSQRHDKPTRRKVEEWLAARSGLTIARAA